MGKVYRYEVGGLEEREVWALEASKAKSQASSVWVAITLQAPPSVVLCDKN